MRLKQVLSRIFTFVLAVGFLCAVSGVSQATESDRYGGILKKAYFAPGSLDPAFAADITGGEIPMFWGDFLVYIDEQSKPDQSRSLAKKWSVSSDGLAWTFQLRQGVVFHNGEKFTSKDVKSTFDRLRDPKIGAATVELYSGISDITTPDASTVVFKLKKTNPDFLSGLGDYHSTVLWHGMKNFGKEFVGTGAFMVESYMAEDRMIFKRNPNYWRMDSQGNRLPYVDGIEYLFLAEASAQVEALRGGQVDYLMYLPADYVRTVEEDPNLAVYKTASNTHYVVHMRSDRKPFSDVRVRQAFRATIDRESILIGSAEGLGVTGRDTPIGPAYGDFYLDVPEIKRDIKKAKKLLAEAGYSNGFEITMTAQQTGPVPAMATIMKEQLAEIGVTVNIQMVPPDVYYGADNLWLEADFSITDWGARAVPQNYLDLAYTCAAKWNESHFCDAELDKLAAMAATETDRAKRAGIYHKIQKLFMDRGPIMVPFFSQNLWGATKKLKGLVPTGYLGTNLDLNVVYFED